MSGTDSSADTAPVRREDMFRSIGHVAEAVSATTVPPSQTAANAADEGDAGDAAAPSLPSNVEMAGDVMVIKSLCMNCEEQGVTRLLMTRIPFFRDIILMAFECEHCGYRNSEVQSAEVQEKGVRFEVEVTAAEDLNRQLVKSDRATVIIPALGFEIPPNTQKGVFTTVEGIMSRAIESLESTQPVRRAVDPDTADSVDKFLTLFRSYLNGEHFPFSLVLDDPSGNSFLENLHAPKHDPHLKIRFYTRTKDQNESLGLFAESAGQGFEDEASALEHDTTMGADAAAAAVAAGAGAGAAAGAGAKEEPADVEGDSALMVGSAATTVWESKDLDGNVPGKFKKGGALIQNPTERGAQTERVRRAEAVRDDSGALSGLVFDSSSSDAAKEVMRFPTNCTNCSAKGECRMCVTDVPHFKEVILMSFSCDECGWKDVEVKGGGAVPDKGTLTELRYNPDAPTAHADLTRDVIKGDSANVEIPEIDLVLSHGSLGGMYTTVEGLLTAIRDKLVETDPFHAERGDSAGGEQYRAFEQFLENLERVRSGSMAFTLRLRDPMANSWIYSPLAPAPDPALVHVEYERSAEEDLELGLLDMKVENYASAEDEEAAAKANAPTHATA